MSIRRRRFAPVLALMPSLLLPSVASAQSTGDWSALNAVASGSKLAGRP